MEIRDRLNQKKVPRLKQFAKQLELTGYSRKKKQGLIDFIIANRSQEKNRDRQKNKT
jgi:hypothetical protein